MSSIIVVDSSDEEADGTSKRSNAAAATATTVPTPTISVVSSLLVARMNQQQTAINQSPVPQTVVRMNSIKSPAATVSAKKSSVLPNDNFKIHLPSKRTVTSESITMPATPTQAEHTPAKRTKRLKPTTIVRSNDEEWKNRQLISGMQRNGGADQVRVNTPTMSMMTSKNVVNAVKAGPVRVVKSPNTVGSATRNVHSPARVVVSPAPGSNSKNYVRFAWNGKEQKPGSPTVISKSIVVTAKEQPKTSPATTTATPMPLPAPAINRNPTTIVKDQSKGIPLSPPIFNKSAVTIRRVTVNDERPKAVQIQKPPNNTVAKLEQPKTSSINVNATSIRRIPLTTDPLKITPIPTPNRNANNSSIKLNQVSSIPGAVTTSNASIRKTTSNPSESIKTIQSLAMLKRNVSISRVPQSNDPSMVVTPTQPVPPTTSATIRKIMNVDLPPSSSLTPKANPTSKKTTNDLTKSTMSLSVVTKSNTGSPTPPSGLSPLLTRPSGLIVTPINNPTVAAVSAAPSQPQQNERPINRLPPATVTRAFPKSTRTPNRGRPPTKSTDQSMVSTSPYNMFPPSGAFMGGPPMIYDVDPSGGSFINPAYIPNRPMRSMEGTSYPTMSSPVFNMNFPSFSGGSITPVTNTGTTPSATIFNAARSSKSPITSTVTKSSNLTRNPANNVLSIPIDVDQPITSMSPPVFNMNHPPFNGDPFNFLQNSHMIPSPAYSPVRSTNSPSNSKSSDVPPATAISTASPLFPRDLDDFVRNPQSYPRAPNNASTSSTFTGNGPIVSADSRSKNRQPTETAGLSFKSPTSTKASPTHSTISDGSSLCDSLVNLFSATDDKSKNDKPENGKPHESETEKPADGEDEKHKEEKEPLNPEYETLLQVCRDADSSDDMNKLIEKKLVRYYYSVHPDFAKSRGFRRAVVAATDNIRKHPDLVYYHLRPVVEEMKARKNSKTIVMTNDEVPAASAAVLSEQEKKAEKRRNDQIRSLNKTLYILTRKIHKLENEDVDLNDENSSYLIVERYKKRACDIYAKICDLTGESKHALRQVKKPIAFKGTTYPEFNKILESYVNRTKEFPDFCDVLRMLEFCNEHYHLNLLKEEMNMIAEEAFIKIGKLLQSRRKADLYETVSHFTSNCDDPAANDPALLAKLAENEKKRTSIGSIIDRYAREQVQRKIQSGDELVQTSEGTDTDGAQSNYDEEQPSTSAASEKSNPTSTTNQAEQQKKAKNPAEATTNGVHSPNSPHLVSSATPSPSASTSASVAFRTSPPHAFISPQASPSQRLSSVSPPPILALPPPPPPPSPPAATPAPCPTSQPWSTTTSSLKILSVTSLNDSAIAQESTLGSGKALPAVKASTATASMDEIIISDEDL